MTHAQEHFNVWQTTLANHALYGKELAAIATNPEEILERFHMDLEFGTAGLRGILGAGTNRMNLFTVGKATQGLATYLLETTESPSVAIAYDSRNFSKEFATHAATVFAANGVHCHLYAELVPTPALSYAVRELGCDSGINITASHNPAEYNGYKAYGPDGCQLSTEASTRVMEVMEHTDIFSDVKTMDFEAALTEKLVEYIPDAFIEQFIHRVFQESLQPEVCAKANLNVVYTPLYGAGRRSVLRVLEKLGAKHVSVVPEQEHPNGDFPTAPYPNPEAPAALALGLALATEKGADILIATDPDCDRLGVAVHHDGDYRILTGNEVGVLLLDYIINTRKALGTLPTEAFCIRTIVTTKLTDAIAAASNVAVRATLTGFKNIGGIIREQEEKGKAENYIFGFEESCGYLSGTYVRDKDAVNAAMLTVEMAAAYKLQGKTLVDVVDEFCEIYGHYHNYTQNFAFSGVEGMEIMAKIMSKLRHAPLTEIAEHPVVAYTDYETSVRQSGNKQTVVDIPKSDVLEYELANGSSILVRPSGTEPKVKVYYLIRGVTNSATNKLEHAAREDMTQIIEGLAK